MKEQKISLYERANQRPYPTYLSDQRKPLTILPKQTDAL